MDSKLLKVKGDSKLVINQETNLSEAKNPIPKRYKEAVWDEIDCFEAFGIIVVPRTC